MWVLAALVAVSVVVFLWWTSRSGERLVTHIARTGLPEPSYVELHNVTLPTLDGTTQIDHILVSRFGIFVVETKDMSGWIFGNAYQRQWTEVIFGRKYRFQNPLHQNFKHVKALEALLDVPAEAIRSVVVFTGRCQIKTPMPANVVRDTDFIAYVMSFQAPVLSEAQVQAALSEIQAQRMEPSLRTELEHIEHLKSRADRSAERKCPKCGSRMVLRTAKRGPGTGQQFWGCSAYPKCRVVQDIR